MKKRKFFHTPFPTYVSFVSTGSYYLSLPLFLRRASEVVGSYFLVKFEFLRRPSEVAGSYYLSLLLFLRRPQAERAATF